MYSSMLWDVQAHPITWKNTDEKMHMRFIGMIVHPIRASVIAPATVVAAGINPA